VDIGATQAGSFNADEYLVVSRLGIREFFQSQVIDAT
jgi:hypothetical protein